MALASLVAISWPQKVLKPIDLMRIRIQFWIQGFDNRKFKKFTAIKLFFIIFWIENCNLLIFRPPKGRTSYRESLQPSKENVQHFKTWKFFTFSIFVGHFCPPDPDPATQINADLDLETTLQFSTHFCGIFFMDMLPVLYSRTNSTISFQI
jgi:hypothetical protein